MASEERQTDLRSVMFMAGACDRLLSNSDGYQQLDGVLELLEFANSYVLSDHIRHDDGNMRVERNEIRRANFIDCLIFEEHPINPDEVGKPKLRVMGAQALTSLVEGLNEQRRVLSRV